MKKYIFMSAFLNVSRPFQAKLGLEGGIKPSSLIKNGVKITMLYGGIQGAGLNYLN